MRSFWLFVLFLAVGSGLLTWVLSSITGDSGGWWIVLAGVMGLAIGTGAWFYWQWRH